MPLQYAGVLEEHRACRERAVVFDVSHLGTVECRGAGRARRCCSGCSPTTSADRARARAVHAPARSRRRARRRRHHRVVGRPRPVLRDAERVEHRPTSLAAVGEGLAPHRRARSSSPTSRATRAVLAVQGPARAGAARGGEAGGGRGAAVRRWRGWASWIVAGTGYTGEDGVEIHVAAAHAPDALGRDRRRRASRRPASARATRCASRPGCRCTATSSARASRRCRRASAGSSRWDKGDFRGPRAAGSGARAGSGAPAARPLGRGPAPGARRRTRCCSTAPRSARSRAATSHRRSATRSRSRCCGPTSRSVRAVQLDVRGTLLDGEVIKPPFVGKIAHDARNRRGSRRAASAARSQLRRARGSTTAR